MQNNSEPKQFLSDDLQDRLLLFGGVIIPIAAALFESTTHFCARLFFDPFPSANHLIMFLLIPLSNFMAWNLKRRDMSRHYFFMALSSGMAAGIAVMYSVMFLPILGLSLLFSLAFGFGLLGMAPMIAIPCTIRSGALVCNAATKQTYFDPHQVKHIGHLIILIMVVAMELPSTMTRINLGLADDPASAARGITWLRQYGSQEVMLRACYERSGRATDILGSIYESAHPLKIDDARRIYYRVTGNPFNSVPIPAAARATIQHAGLATDVAGVNAKVDDEFDLDGDIAGEKVSGVARGLSASACNVEGTIDPDALLSKIKWSIAFQNGSKYDREARAKVLLPRGGVVTGASVVVNGIERDATLMLRGVARVKYVRSVAAAVKQKDPLLVSTSGPDEVLVQCFPVQPGKPLVVHLSIVCPLTLEEKSKGVLGFPIIVERNFQLNAPVQISLESKRQLSANNLRTVSFQRKKIDSKIADEKPVSAVSKLALRNDVVAVKAQPPVSKPAPKNDAVSEKTPLAVSELLQRNEIAGNNTSQHGSETETVYTLSGSIEHPVLNSISAFVRAERDGNCQSVFCRENFTPEGNVIRRNIRSERYVQPRKLSIIVDGSEHMRGTIDDVTRGLSELPKGMPVDLTFVGDETIKLCSVDTKSGDTKFEAALNRLQTLGLVGGQDDSTALAETLLAASKTADQSVLWIHGAQPISKPGQSVVRPLVETNRPLIYDFAVAAGPTEIFNGVYTGPAFVRVTRSGSIEKDLRSLSDAWSLRTANGDNPLELATANEYMIEQPSSSGHDITGYETDSSLAQLYANRKIVEDLNKPEIEQLTKIASSYHVVSPVSSAVVTVDDSTEIKTVNTAVAPEADTWLLLIIVAGLIAFIVHRKRLQEANV